MNTSKSLAKILEDFWNETLFEYGTEYAGNGGIPDYNKPKEKAVTAIVEAVEGLIDQPIDIFITNDLPSLLDGGETAAMYYDHFMKKLRQAIKEWQ